MDIVTKHLTLHKLAQDKTFLNPDYEQGLHDPTLLPDADLAAERILKAIDQNERILIYGDFDADGLPATAILVEFFTQIGHTNIEYMVPHRHFDGFGLHSDKVLARAPRPDVVITVDCGTANHESAAELKAAGIDVIITDHHSAPLKDGEQNLPDAVAVVNPKRLDSSYPFPELCGAGVAYKLVQLLLRERRELLPVGYEKWLLDLVAIATIGDMVPLIDENRVLVTYGLKVIRAGRRSGLRAVLESPYLDLSQADEKDVAFTLIPRLNAASRMGRVGPALDLLMAKDARQAATAAAELETLNKMRKKTVQSISNNIDAQSESGIVAVGNDEWLPSLLGLVGSSLLSKEVHTAFLWGRDGGGRLKGSCRSNRYDVCEVMRRVDASLLQWGGHVAAGGFALKETAAGTFAEQLVAAITELPEVAKETDALVVTSTVAELSNHYEAMQVLKPFGIGNPEPIFEIEAEVKGVRMFGKKEEHCEITLRDATGVVPYIKFFADDKPKSGDALTVRAHVEWDNYSKAIRLRPSSE